MKGRSDQWTRLARTPETRARIRRGALRERAFGALIAIGMGLCALMVAVSIYVAAFQTEFHHRSGWFLSTTVGMLLAIAFLARAVRFWIATNKERVRAMYADGQEAVGTVTEVVEDDDRDPDTGPYYDISITAELAGAGAGSIRRVTRRAEAPQVGQRVRFRHNTLDPEDLEDVLFLGFVNEDDRE
ncbi:hypothetical protein ACH4L7_01780 [Streptomyces anulatus]